MRPRLRMTLVSLSVVPDEATPSHRGGDVGEAVALVFVLVWRTDGDPHLAFCGAGDQRGKGDRLVLGVVAFLPAEAVGEMRAVPQDGLHHVRVELAVVLLQQVTHGGGASASVGQV